MVFVLQVKILEHFLDSGVIHGGLLGRGQGSGFWVQETMRLAFCLNPEPFYKFL